MWEHLQGVDCRLKEASGPRLLSSDWLASHCSSRWTGWWLKAPNSSKAATTTSPLCSYSSAALNPFFLCSGGRLDLAAFSLRFYLKPPYWRHSAVLRVHVWHRLKRHNNQNKILKTGCRNGESVWITLSPTSCSVGILWQTSVPAEVTPWQNPSSPVLKNDSISWHPRFQLWDDTSLCCAADCFTLGHHSSLKSEHSCH